MTATTVAPTVWLDLVAGNLHVLQAADRVMEADGCERAAALAAMHRAAAEWLKPLEITVLEYREWDQTRESGQAVLEVAAMKLDAAEARMRWVLAPPEYAVGKWLEWGTIFSRTIAILRELQAIPGGESP